MATYQVGRSQIGGASDAGYATSHDGGHTWTSGVLPGLTNVQRAGNLFDAVSDPAVAYDAAHGVWLIATLPVEFSSVQTPAALVSRSADGVAWSDPVQVAPGQSATDKEWIACDAFATSPFYGHCYIEWDDPSLPARGLIHLSVSSDGGRTWSAPAQTADNATGIAGEPVVEPNGTVVVPLDDFNLANVLAFASTDGGATWSAARHVATIDVHLNAGNLRAGPLRLPSPPTTLAPFTSCGPTAASASLVPPTISCSPRRATQRRGRRPCAFRSTP